VAGEDLAYKTKTPNVKRLADTEWRWYRVSKPPSVTEKCNKILARCRSSVFRVRRGLEWG
jgi:hypothetical protein